MHQVKRIFVEKKADFNTKAQHLLHELQIFLNIEKLNSLRLINRYDLAINEKEFELIRQHIFPDTIADQVFVEELPLQPQARVLIKEYLPGQFDPRVQATSQNITLITSREKPLLRTAEIMILTGNLSPEELVRIKDYWINPLEARQGSWDKPTTLQETIRLPQSVAVLENFVSKTPQELQQLHQGLGLAMSEADLRLCQSYFRQQAKRNPTLTEIRIVDTYWSDHCRHKTFFTPIKDIIIEAGPFTQPVKEAYQAYLKTRDTLFAGARKDICLMDLALAGMKELRHKGYLDDLDISEEINACSINVTVEVDGTPQEWLVMFKNETHNHPTEIEPFGGAATCLGGAIRDPLSGRAYVYQAMRVTGSGDPRGSWQNTLPGKLPQRQITREAAKGYSFYGNQIGIPTGQVAEIYDEGYGAKRMELGAVIAAAPKRNIRRQSPQPGDVVLLVGNKTGRDGCGGATGSSKEHSGESNPLWGSEVPKGNPVEERKLLRLFRNPKASQLIKKCNDFGAGGVSVAVGELADGLTINLDAVPTVYQGLDGTELAISESQERMAVVIAPEDAPTFIRLAEAENLIATAIAGVTPARQVKMYWKGNLIVNLDRDFLDTGGIKGQAVAKVTSPQSDKNPFYKISSPVEQALPDLKAAWLANLQDLNVCSQKSLADRFDSTAGGGTVVAPFGGQYQATPAQGMVAKIPVLAGETTTGTIMTFGYNPRVSRWSPFHGGLYAVIEAVAKNVILGGDHRRIRMTCQEYFEKLEDVPEKWGKPFSALLGAYWAQKNFLIPAIGGKDSMSGTWQDLHVPPTLVAFTVNTVDVRKTVTGEFKQIGSQVVLVPAPRDEQEIPDFDILNKNFTKIHELIQEGYVLSASIVTTGGLAAALSQMAFGNSIGVTCQEPMDPRQLFSLDYGSIILELAEHLDLEKVFGEVAYQLLGTTQSQGTIGINGIEIPLPEAYQAWASPLTEVFGNRVLREPAVPLAKEYKLYEQRNSQRPSLAVAKPLVLIPIFPGTNGEYEGERAFTKARGLVKTFIFRDRTSSEVKESLHKLAQKLRSCQILMLPGGFTSWDEPDGAGKYMEAILRQPIVQEAIIDLLEKDGLILGIGNGFQALVQLGLLPYGEIREHQETAPLLTLNQVGHHVAQYVKTKVISTLSPWFQCLEIGEEHTIPISCTEGRLIAEETELELLFQQGQVATQYIDDDGRAASSYPYNPTGSFHAIEGITSPDGRILGKMGHSERYDTYGAINIYGHKDQRLFEAGITYFR